MVQRELADALFEYARRMQGIDAERQAIVDRQKEGTLFLVTAPGEIEFYDEASDFMYRLVSHVHEDAPDGVLDLIEMIGLLSHKAENFPGYFALLATFCGDREDGNTYAPIDWVAFADAESRAVELGYEPIYTDELLLGEDVASWVYRSAYGVLKADYLDS